MKAVILWASGNGQQIDIKREEGGSIVLAVRGGSEPLETCTLHSSDVMAVKSLAAVAKAVGLLEGGHVS